MSRGKVNERVLEQWEALLLFFQTESVTDKVDGAAEIYKTMTTSGTKRMLLFLNYVLKKVNIMNVELQSEYYRLHKLYPMICGEYRNILGMFIKRDVLDREKLSVIDPSDSKLHVALNRLNVGGRCEALLLKEPLGRNEDRFRSDCLQFLTVLCCQIRKRFPFKEDGVIAMLCNTDPNVAVSCNRQLNSIIRLARHFPSLVSEDQYDKLQDEWEAIINAKETIEPMLTLENS